MKLQTTTILVSAVILPATTFASPAGAFFYELFNDPYFWLFLLVGALLLLAYVSVRNAFNTLKRVMRPDLVKSEEEIAEKASAGSTGTLARWYKKLSGLKPMEKEKDLMLDHDYDGIRELDNSLPPWWLYGFYITIAISVVYMLHFHVFKTGALSEEEYRVAMEKAEVEVEAYFESIGGAVNEDNVTLVEDDRRLANGKKLFDANCAVCHAHDGGGGVGPNLADEYWIHGGSINDVFRVIKHGVPAKGMVPWKDILGATDIQDVASYVLTLQDNEPANPKAPEGDKYTR